MKSTCKLDMNDVRQIAAACEQEAATHQWPVTLAICDEGGHLLWLQRLDGAAPLSARIAPGKAITAAIGRRESAVYEKMVNDGRFSFIAVEGLTPLEGGVPIVVDGQCLGAVGVSGVKSAEDRQIALAGIAAWAGR